MNQSHKTAFVIWFDPNADIYFTPILTGGDNGLDTFVVSQHTRLYAEAGSIVELSTAATEDGSSFTVTVSGYLVDR